MKGVRQAVIKFLVSWVGWFVLATAAAALLSVYVPAVFGALLLVWWVASVRGAVRWVRDVRSHVRASRYGGDLAIILASKFGLLDRLELDAFRLGDRGGVRGFARDSGGVRGNGRLRDSYSGVQGGGLGDSSGQGLDLIEAPADRDSEVTPGELGGGVSDPERFRRAYFRDKIPTAFEDTQEEDAEGCG